VRVCVGGGGTLALRTGLQRAGHHARWGQGATVLCLCVSTTTWTAMMAMLTMLTMLTMQEMVHERRRDEWSSN